MVTVSERPIEVSLPDRFTAILELLWARLEHSSITPARLIDYNTAASSGTMGEPPAEVLRVASAIVWTQGKVPWRSDCMLQALAARRWLMRLGFRPRIHLGIPAEKQERFFAHAWLSHEGFIVTGGDVSSYVEMPLCRN